MRRTAVLDVTLVLVVAVSIELQVFSGENAIGTHIAGPRWLTVLLPLALALPLLWRRSRPLLVCAIVMAGIAAQALVSGDSPEGLELIVLWVLVPYSVAAYSERREAFIGLGLLLAGYAVYALENRDVMSGTADNVWAAGFFLVLAVGAWLAGLAINSRRASAALSARAAALEQEAALAAREERSRMARELHDIVAHNLSVVVVQAAGARAQAEQPATTLEKIERSGREALVEMRRLLGVLREDGDASLAPPPGIAQLPELVERVRAAGVPVELTIAPGCEGLPPAVDLSGYRIVQEALTNTLKHAGAHARAQVRLGREAGALTIAVVDDGAGANGAGGGHGLIGIRERVALFGGELRAGPRLAGGFEVQARLPLP